MIDTGPQRVVHRYEPNNGAATHSAPGGHLGVLTGRRARERTRVVIDEFLTRTTGAIANRPTTQHLTTQGGRLR